MENKKLKNKKLSDELFDIIKPLDVFKFKFDEEKQTWKIEKIEGSFDYKKTKKALFDCLSTIRNQIGRLSRKCYLSWFTNRNQLQQLDKGIYLYDRIMQAFLEALSTTPKNLNTKMSWSFEMRFLLDSHRLMVDSANNLYQDINEKHVRVTLVIAVIALILSIIFNVC